MGATFWWQKYRTTYWFRPKWPITKHLCPYGNVLSISYLLLRQCRAGSKTFWPLPSPLKPGSSSLAPVEPAGLLGLHTLCLHVQSVEPFPTVPIGSFGSSSGSSWQSSTLTYQSTLWDRTWRFRFVLRAWSGVSAIESTVTKSTWLQLSAKCSYTTFFSGHQPQCSTAWGFHTEGENDNFSLYPIFKGH